jgi:signal transduction histidine kinase
MLFRLLSNLINNSFEAQSSEIKLELSTEAEYIKLAIIDNGSGITPEVLSTLGTRGNSHGKSSGYGLGLSSAKEAVEASGGNLKIESKINIGTRVTLNLLKASQAR